MALYRVFLVFVLTLGLFQVQNVQSQDRVEQTIDGKRYYIHVVEQGHTLYAISKLYGCSIEDIINANPGVENGISIGDNLKIPAEISSDKWENPIRIEQGYLIHRVKRGETLFAIAKSYKVDVNDILELNPNANGGIHKGDELMIPKNDVDEVSLPSFSEEEKDSLHHHFVQQGETLYGISKVYDVEVEDIMEVNGGLPEGLKSGMELRIPIPVLEEIELREEEFTLVLPDSQLISDKYQLMMMLPFYLHYLDSTSIPAKEARIQEISLALYRGGKLAISSLEEEGLNADLFIRDVYNDSTLAISMDSTAHAAHLIVGPLQKGPLSTMLKQKKNPATHVVCPVQQGSKVLLSNENVSKVIPSSITEMDRMGEFVADNHFDHNVILINSGFLKDQMMVDEFRASFIRQKQEHKEACGTFREVSADSEMNSIEELGLWLSDSSRNVIVLPAGKSSKTVVADLFTDLSQLEQDKYRITVYGAEEWLKFNFIDPSHKNRFNLRLPSHSYVNYSDSATIAFVKEFRKQYKSEPAYFDFMGYDLLSYYGKALLYYGADFPNHFDGVGQDALLQSGFSFYKTGLESGYENRYFRMFEFVDYKLQPIDINAQ